MEKLRCVSCLHEASEFRHLYALPRWGEGECAAICCPVCSFKFMHPAPSSLWLSQYYSNRDLYGSYSQHPEDYRNAVIDKETLLKEFLSAYGPPDVSGQLAIDFGAGCGYVVKACQNLGMRAFGLELQPNAPETAQSLFGVDVYNKGLEAVPDHSAAVFSMFEVLEHIPNPLGFLDEVKCKMLPDGLLIGSVPNYNGLGRFLFGTQASVFIFPEHVNYFDVASLRDILSRAGFEPLFVGYRNPNQVILDLGLRKLVYRFLGRGAVSDFLATSIAKVKRYLVYPLLNAFVERTGWLGHGLTFVARPVATTDRAVG